MAWAPFIRFIHWLETTDFATAIRESLFLTGILSAVHLLGVVLIIGSALLTCLRSLGLLFPEQPFGEIARPAGKAVLYGAGITILTGALLFAARVTMAVYNGTFQIKMILLIAALAFQFTVFRRAARRTDEASPRLYGFAGALGFLLWFAVGFAGSWYILFAE